VKRRFKIEKEGLPDLAGMMLVTVEALKEMGGSASIDELDEKVIEMERVPEEEQALVMANESGRPRVNYYLAWARTYLKRGEAVENSSRGVWSLTPIGYQITDYAQTEAIHERVSREERERARLKRLQTKAAPTAQDKDLPDPVEAAKTDETGPDQTDWKAQLLSVLGDMHPSAFERLSQRLLRESGFTKVEVRGKTGDGGIDGVGVLRMNLVSFQVYFQCKRWKGSVGPKEIRDFRGAMQGRADKGIFVTTGHYTAAASDEATRDGAMAIDLIDGDRLCDLLKENRLGVSTELIESVRIDPNWFKAI
jgi:restriction system protein